MQDSVFTLLKESGFAVSNGNARGYKPSIRALPNFDCKLLKVLLWNCPLPECVHLLLLYCALHFCFTSDAYRHGVLQSAPYYYVVAPLSCQPQNILSMLHTGSRDIGFGGADWVAELGIGEELEMVRGECSHHMVTTTAVE